MIAICAMGALGSVLLTCLLLVTNINASEFYARAGDPDSAGPTEPAVSGAPEPSFSPHDWIHMAGGLVAHAGGTVEGYGRIYGTNSREAVLYSYSRGHRVFELDFRLTTDNRLAAVHNWYGHGGRMSSEEWKAVQILDRFTSMLLECVLDIMLVNRDMFIITDTKSFEYSPEDMVLQFEILVETARRKDPALLERIIPQIYNREMYYTIMSLHEFKSVIYTLYASPDSDSEVVEFVSRHSNISVVTMAPERGAPEFIRELQNAGKHIYFFTINDLDEMLYYREAGVHGFYTSFIFPGDLL